jgi:hypothetical protein
MTVIEACFKDTMVEFFTPGNFDDLLLRLEAPFRRRAAGGTERRKRKTQRTLQLAENSCRAYHSRGAIGQPAKPR